MDEVTLLRAALRAALELAETRRLQLEATWLALEEASIERDLLVLEAGGGATTEHRYVAV